MKLEWLDDIFEDLIVGHNFDYARAAIATKLEQMELEARIDELNNLMHRHQQVVRKGKIGTVAVLEHAVLNDDTQRRLAELKARLTQKGDSDEYPSV